MKHFGKIELDLEVINAEEDTCHMYTMTFRPGWSVTDYKVAAEEMYDYMQKVNPQKVFVIADFGDPELSFRRDIIGPVVIDPKILKLSVDAPSNRVVYFVFSNSRLLSFAKFSASAYKKFIDDLMQPKYIVNTMEEARKRIKAECAGVRFW